MLDYRSLGTGNEGSVLTADPPILSIRDKLQEPNNAEIFTVETDDDRGWYWRAIALDHLADETWTVPPTDAEPASNLDTPDSLPTSVLARQRFDLRDLDAFWLPAAYRPTRIDLDDAQVVPKSLTLYRPSGGLRDIQYTVESQVPQPTEAELDAVTWDDVADQPELTELPDGFSQRVRDLAADVTDNGASSPYEAAAAIEAYFSPENGFTYTLDTDLHSSSSAHEAFLFDTKAGFCEQYASAFAVMARSVGLPTRVAVGYQSGELRSDRRWHVTNRDAHAWPEVWLGSTIGWYAFEPTPGRTNPATGRGTAPEAGSATTTTTPTSSGATTPTSSGASDPGPVRPGEVAADGSPITSPTNDDTTQRTLLALGAILAAAILGAIVVLVVAIVRAWLRTRRRRHDPDPRRRVLGAWAEALERMVAAGVDPRPSATPTEFALRYAPAHGAGAAGPPLMELARLQTEAMFAAESPSDDDAAAAWRHVDEIDRELKRAVSFRNRWYRRLRPEPRPEIEREPTEDSIRDRSALVEASVE
jgi:transglutaminase-like putative cysteine protease